MEPWRKTRDCFCYEDKGGAKGGDRPPLKPTKVTLFTMILYNSENSIHEQGHFAVHCFVTALLWSLLHLSYSSEPVIRLDYQILLKSFPLNLLAGSAPTQERRRSYKHLDATPRFVTNESDLCKSRACTVLTLWDMMKAIGRESKRCKAINRCRKACNGTHLSNNKSRALDDQQLKGLQHEGDALGVQVAQVITPRTASLEQMNESFGRCVPRRHCRSAAISIR